ncbi:hypothetical protein HRI_000763100 [Hibiscus trionum]|uniref:Uncharacterized protein n=1 Tax=Hibiscus trionum TaxID=183268 RepID=A0A9W7LNC2_HIBTR|nr:hypothetical protein HRI_000763100 [Hibiscus trionum]
MMDNKEIEFFEKVWTRKEVEVCASESSGVKYGVHKPLVVSVRPRVASAKPVVTQKIVISTPALFAFKSTNAVPWNYTTSVSIPEKEKLQEIKPSGETKKESEKEKQSNAEAVIEVGHFTRSGRCYSSP